MVNFTKIAYIYGLYDHTKPDIIRYIGKSIIPKKDCGNIVEKKNLIQIQKKLLGLNIVIEKIEKLI